MSRHEIPLGFELGDGISVAETIVMLAFGAAAAVAVYVLMELMA